MPLRPPPAMVQAGLVGALVATGLAGIFVALLPSFAAQAKQTASIALTLGEHYRHQIREGAEIQIAFAPDSLPPGGRIDVLGVGADSTVLGQKIVRPSRVARRAGTLTTSAPPAAGSVSYWIALDPVDGNDAMHLTVTPEGQQPQGTPLTATLTGVPAGDTVYLMGIDGRNPDAQGAQIADYIPPANCAPDPSASGHVVCSFQAPPDAQPVSDEAHTTNGSLESLPANDLPEVPAAAALPLAALPAFFMLRRRLGGAR